MSQIFSSVLGSLGQSFAKNPLGLLLGGMGIINQMTMASKEKKALDQSLYYAKHPEAISAIQAKLQKPLSTGLTQGVENIVNASMAEQGLSQAPGIQSQVLSQALAPYQQREQEMALGAALQAIGLPNEALRNLGGAANPAGLASLLKLILPNQGGGGQQGGGWGSELPSGTLDVPYQSQDVTLGIPTDAPLTPPIFDTGGGTAVG